MFISILKKHDKYVMKHVKCMLNFTLLKNIFDVYARDIYMYLDHVHDVNIKIYLSYENEKYRHLSCLNMFLSR